MATLQIVETSLRDGNQCLWGALGIDTARTLTVAPLMERVGYRAIDFTTSTHMGVTVRYKQEDPWERIRAMGMGLGGDVFRRQSLLDRPGDLERSSGIRCPTLVVAAENDQLRSLAEAQEMTAAIPGATLAVIEDTGHMIPLEAPQRLLDVIVPWLAAQAEG